MIKSRADTANYKQLFLDNVPLLDVRAPVEFAAGSFPGAVNLPLMTDIEREQVGITYKNEGQEAAIAMGHKLVGGDIKAQRIEAWRSFAVANPNGYLYCFRGGLRSQIAQTWMQEAGVEYPRVTGGYKAMRRFLIDETERQIKSRDFVIVAGRTGTGKTLLLNSIENSLDLEGLANHRGSSFGRRPDDQPSQIDFENSLAVNLMELSKRPAGPVFIEDESIRIGQLALPLSLSSQMPKWPMVIVEEPLEARIDVIHRDYVTGLLAEFRVVDDEQAFDRFSEFLTSALYRVRKRLGGLKYQEINVLLQTALDVHRDHGEVVRHREWIEALLAGYYDPMYDYQLAQKNQSILFSGSRSELRAWIQGKP